MPHWRLFQNFRILTARGSKRGGVGIQLHCPLVVQKIVRVKISSKGPPPIELHIVREIKIFRKGPPMNYTVYFAELRFYERDHP